MKCVYDILNFSFFLVEVAFSVFFLWTGRSTGAGREPVNYHAVEALSLKRRAARAVGQHGLQTPTRLGLASLRQPPAFGADKQALADAEGSLWFKYY